MPRRRTPGPAARREPYALGAGRSQGKDFSAIRIQDSAPHQNGAPEATSGYHEPPARLFERWELWFPSRPGPWRKRTATVDGRRITGRVQVNELPPSLNDRLHPQVKARWVKEWRGAAFAAARERDLPRLEHVRVSVIVYRHRLGVADPDNDWGRIKPLLDGLRDASALAQDTYGAVELGTIEERRGDHGILLIVEEIAPRRPERDAGDGRE